MNRKFQIDDWVFITEEYDAKLHPKLVGSFGKIIDEDRIGNFYVQTKNSNFWIPEDQLSFASGKRSLVLKLDFNYL